MAGKFVNQEKRSRPGVLLICLTLLIGIGIGMMLPKVNLRHDKEDPGNQIETDSPQQGEEIATESTAVQVTEERIAIETAVCQLQFPEMYSECLRHTEVTQDGVIMEVFSMAKEETDWELFRIYFSTEESENDIGFLRNETGNQYVTLTVCEHSDDEFADAESREEYYAMMGSLDVVLASIRNNSNFSQKGEVEINVVDATLDYWNISVPDNMEWEETSENGRYLVTFYGNVNGEKIKLYVVAVGTPELKSVLGGYSMEGTVKPVSVESYDLPVTDNWTEEAITELYTMMATINDVIKVIMSSEDFSAELPEA